MTLQLIVLRPARLRSYRPRKFPRFEKSYRSIFTGKVYNNLKEVYDALTNREVKGMLIDAFTVGSKKHLFNRRDLRISKLLDYKAAYGVVLGGEAKKLQKCLQRYVGEQRSEISKIVETNVETIEVGRIRFDPKFRFRGPKELSNSPGGTSMGIGRA